MNLAVDDQSALTMPIPSDRPAALIAFPRGDARPQLAVLQQVAAACALEVGRIDAAVERFRGSGAILLNDALSGRVELATRDRSAMVTSTSITRGRS